MQRSFRFVVLFALVAVMLVSCLGRPTQINPAGTEIKPISLVEGTDMPVIGIARHPAPDNYASINPDPAPPQPYDSASDNPFQNDYRSADLSGLDLSQSLEGLLFSDFDSRTVWPEAEQMPAGFDPQQIMELGKDPGLGVRLLHDQGITGRGVGIAIIDQTLLVDHQEYKDRIKLYEESNGKEYPAQMHGPAVASIAVGKTVGVAPQANLYFLADISMADYTHLASSIRRIVEINRSLPAGHKIRVLSISIGWMPEDPGVDELTAAVNAAKTAGIFVISMDIYETYGWGMIGMGRSARSDPNDFASYTPSPWWSERFYENPAILNPPFLLIPMDARATASPTGVEDYAFYAVGGMSWTAPYLAGMYALACQVKPAITPEQFWSTALQTGKTTTLRHAGKDYSFGVILDPQALIAALQK